MTQKEIVLAELIRQSSGLTANELRERTGVPENSLRTVLWEMRKEGWIEVVGGVRGRYRYAATEEGRNQAPATASKTAHSDKAPKPDLARRTDRGDIAIGTYVDEHRRLNDFVRWLVLEKPELFPGNTYAARKALERAVEDYVEKDVDLVRRYIEAELERQNR